MAATRSRKLFMSPEWIEMARDELVKAIATCGLAQSLRISVIERYSDVPVDAPQPERGEPGLWLTVDHGEAEVRYGIQPDELADVEIDCDYRDAWVSVCLRHGQELEAFNASRLASGRLRIRGNPGAARPLFNLVHDRVADRTAPSPV